MPTNLRLYYQLSEIARNAIFIAAVLYRTDKRRLYIATQPELQRYYLLVGELEAYVLPETICCFPIIHKSAQAVYTSVYYAARVGRCGMMSIHCTAN